jgi:hypothetical protein
MASHDGTHKTKRKIPNKTLSAGVADMMAGSEDQMMLKEMGCDVIIGRAVLTVDNKNYFQLQRETTKKQKQNRFPDSSVNRFANKSGASNITPQQTEDKSARELELMSTTFHLWFLELLDEESKLSTPICSTTMTKMRTNNCSAAVILETVYTHHMCARLAEPVALLVFHCDLEVAVEVLRSGQFKYHSPEMSNIMTIQWLTEEQFVYGCISYHDGSSATRYRSYTESHRITDENRIQRGEGDRWKDLMCLADLKLTDFESNRLKSGKLTKKKPHCSISTASMSTYTWGLGGMLGIWANRGGDVRSVHLDDEFDRLPLILLYFHYRLRSHNVNFIIAQQILDGIKSLSLSALENYKREATADGVVVPVLPTASALEIVEDKPTAPLTEEAIEVQAEALKMGKRKEQTIELNKLLQYINSRGNEAEEDDVNATASAPPTGEETELDGFDFKSTTIFTKDTYIQSRAKRRKVTQKAKSAELIKHSDLNQNPWYFVKVAAKYVVDNREMMARNVKNLVTLLADKKINDDYYKTTVVRAKAKAIVDLASVEMYQISTTEGVTTDAIKMVPLNVFDVETNKTWCDKVASVIGDKTSVEAVMSKMCDPVTCVVGTSRYSNTYGTAESNASHLRLQLAAVQQLKIHGSDKRVDYLARRSVVRKPEIDKFVLESDDLVAMIMSDKEKSAQIEQYVCDSDLIEKCKIKKTKKRTDTQVDLFKSALEAERNMPYRHRVMKSKNATINAIFVKSSLNGLPVWHHREEVATSKGPVPIYVYHSLTRTKKKPKKRDVNGRDKAIERYMYAKDDEVGGCNEITSPMNNVTNLILDVDLHSSRAIDFTATTDIKPEEAAMLDGKEFWHRVYSQMIAVAEYAVLRRIGLRDTDVVHHHILKSAKCRVATNSVGLRHVISLSPGVEMSTLTASQSIDMMNTCRHFYPDLKLFGGTSNKDLIYDTAIFGKDGRASHGIRGVYQSKCLGKRDSVLLPVFQATTIAGKCVEYADHTSLVPYAHRFVHGSKEEQPHLIRVVEKFENIFHLEDESYLDNIEESTVHSYAYKKCSTQIDKVMVEFDKKVLMSNPLDPSDVRIHDVVFGLNQLWSNGHNMVVRKRLANEGYPEDVLNDVLGNMCFKLIGSAIQLVYVNNSGRCNAKCLNFCFFKQHQKKTNTYVTAAFSGDSQRVSFFVHCFKSCSKEKRVTASNYEMPYDNDVFLFPLLEYRFFQEACMPMSKQYWANDIQMVYLAESIQESSTKTLHQQQNTVDKKWLEKMVGKGATSRNYNAANNTGKGDKTDAANAHTGSYKGTTDRPRSKEEGVLALKRKRVADQKDLVSEQERTQVGRMHEFISNRALSNVNLRSLYCVDVHDPNTKRRYTLFRNDTQLYVLFSFAAIGATGDVNYSTTRGDEEGLGFFFEGETDSKKDKATKRRERITGRPLLYFSKNATFLYELLIDIGVNEVTCDKIRVLLEKELGPLDQLL